MSHVKQKSITGLGSYLSVEGLLVGGKAVGVGGASSGRPGIVLPGSNDYVAIWEDFVGELKGYTAIQDTGGGGLTVLDTGFAGPYFNVVVGDDGTSSAKVSGATNGVYRFSSSATADGAPNDSERGIVGKGLDWKLDQGPGVAGHLRMSARVRRSEYKAHGGTSCGAVFVGFTDVLTVEFPVWDTGAADTGGVSEASNCVGIMWNANGDTGWVGVAVRGDTELPLVALDKTAPTDNTWTTLEVELTAGSSDTGGLAVFYVDGVRLGQIVSPVTSNVALTPCIYSWDTGGTPTQDVDWVNVSAPRDTGS